MERRWWKEAVVYQVYHRSFKDSNGDGIGDLGGLKEKLGYLQGLGVDVIWLNPVYQSPNDDNGYDISSYYHLNQEFGKMEEFLELLEEVHRRGMKLIMDLVVNHTSDEHPWFIEARSSRNNPRRDYYIWRPPRDGREPNNWRSMFYGSAWEWDEGTAEYYLHLFSRKQPDLNWRNQHLREEIYRMIRWWLDKGIDGFRLDVINFIGKAPGLPDAGGPAAETGEYLLAPQYWANQLLAHQVLQEMNERIFSDYDMMTVGETLFVTPEEGIKYVGRDRKELDMIFHFEHMDLPDFQGDNLCRFKEIQRNWYEELWGRGWGSQYLNNHDRPRQVSRFGDDGDFRRESAKMLATMLLTLPGTPFIYQGEEIGMTNVHFSTIDEYDDIKTVNKYREEVNKGRDPGEVLAELQPISRDNARTPVQWDATANAGFTTGEPWLKVNPNYPEINVEKALADPNSILYYYRKLIKLRRQNLALIYGNYLPLLEEHQRVYSYLRELNGDSWLVLLNFSGKQEEVSLPGLAGDKGQLVLHNYREINQGGLEKIELMPYEARVYHLEVCSDIPNRKCPGWE